MRALDLQQLALAARQLAGLPIPSPLSARAVLSSTLRVVDLAPASVALWIPTHASILSDEWRAASTAVGDVIPTPATHSER